MFECYKNTEGYIRQTYQGGRLVAAEFKAGDRVEYLDSQDNKLSADTLYNYYAHRVETEESLPYLVVGSSKELELIRFALSYLSANQDDDIVQDELVQIGVKGEDISDTLEKYS